MECNIAIVGTARESCLLCSELIVTTLVLLDFFSKGSVIYKPSINPLACEEVDT